MNKLYGYARVSSKEQNEDRQLIALTEYGVPSSHIFIDKISGKDFERTNYKHLIKKLKRGDLLIIKSIDRLGRNYTEIQSQWKYITQDISADIKVLDMPLLDTTQHKDLLGTFISDMVLQLLSFVAENERNNIRQRQSEGIAAAKARGVKFGRPFKYNSADYLPIYQKFLNKEITQKQAMALIGCCESTYYRIIAELKAMQKNP
ncbi:MAG: recombinase family protein [Firmicutes bacterium]|nr:recombinase family protein [Bacillota bacterium]